MERRLTWIDRGQVDVRKSDALAYAPEMHWTCEHFEKAECMMTRRVQSAVWLAVVVLVLMMVGCELGSGARVAATPMPPATPLPPVPPSANTPTPFEEKLQSVPRSMELTKVIDGYLHVRYLPPCEIVPSPAIWVASIILTDLHSGSVAYLNRDGTVRTDPSYLTEEGRTRLEGALEDSSVLEQIVARPECPDGLK